MITNFFWLKWGKPYNYILHALAFILLLSICYLCYATWLFEPISLDTQSQVVTKQLTHHQFERFFIPFTIKEDFHILMQAFYGSKQVNSPLFSYIYLGFLFTGLLFLISSSLELKKSWFYYIIVGVVILFIAQLSIDLLYPDFAKTKALLTIGLVLVFVAIAYSLWSIFPKLSHLLRFLVITLFFTGILLLVSLSNSLSYAVYFTAQHSYIVPSLFAAIFIIFVSQEIPRVILKLSSSEVTGNSSTKGYLLGAIIYIINVLVIYLSYTHVIDANFSFIHPLVLLIVSSLLGIWGSKDRKVLFHKLINYQPHGAIFYLCSAIITIATIGMVYLNDNTPMERFFTGIIVYAHFASALVFFIYVVTNFIPYIRMGHKVYRAVYEGKMFTFWKACLLAAITLAFMVVKEQFAPYHQWNAGREIAKADAYKQSDDILLSHEYYNKSLRHSLVNHKANYALGKLAVKENRLADAIDYYNNAKIKSPTIASYLNLANIYSSFEYNFRDTWTLEEGIKTFSTSAELYNNMAITYTRTNITDSVLHYFNTALSLAPENTVIKANRLALNLYLDAEIDSSAFKIEKTNIPLLNNQLIFNKALGKETENLSLPAIDSVLTTESYALARNLVLSSDDIDISKFLHDIQYLDENMYYNVSIEFLEAINLYQTGNKVAAFRLLEKIERSSTNVLLVSYRYYLGMWHAEHKQYDKAFTYLSQSSKMQLKSKINDATLYAGFIAAILGKHDEALYYLKHPHVQDDAAWKAVADKWISILDHSAELSTVEEKYYATLFDKTLFPSEKIDVALSLNTIDRKASLLNYLLEDIINQRDYNYAKKIISNVKEQHEVIEKLQAKISFRENIIENNFATVNGYPFATDNANEDSSFYQKQIALSPFNPDMYISAAYELSNENRVDEAYDILAFAIQNFVDSDELKIAYCYLSAKNKLTYFTDGVIEDLSLSLTESEFMKFSKTYESLNKD